MALLILGCSSEDTDTPQPSATTPAASQKTAKNKVTITPDNATKQSVIALTANRSLLNNSIINWYVNGSIDESTDGIQFTSPRLEKKDIIQAVLVRNKKEYYSNEITIMNTPPRIKRAAMVPALPRADATLEVEIDAYDVDEDTIYYTYKWVLNGKFITDQNFLSTEFKRDDMITLEITPYDGEDYGSNIFIKNKIFNSLPVVSGNTPSFDGMTYTYHLNATDPDGDVLTYKILEGPKGMSVDTSGMITWEVRPEDAGRYEFTIFINDNNGGELLVPITARIGF